MTFTEIERIVGTKLQKSQGYPAWCSNSTTNNVMTKVWLDAGYETSQVDVRGRKLVFKRVANGEPEWKKATGMSDVGYEFSAEGGEMNRGHSPLFGSMKGTFTLVPPRDSEPPSEDPESWEALALAKLDRLLFGKGN